MLIKLSEFLQSIHFKTVAIDHSAISPFEVRYTFFESECKGKEFFLIVQIF